MTRRTPLALAALAALALAACSGGAEAVTSVATTRPAATPTKAKAKPTPAATPKPRRTPTPASGSASTLNLAFAGADLAVVNFETAITGRGTPEPKAFHFRTRPKALMTLQKAGVDAVSLANNHAVDYGPLGLEDTLAARAASPIPVIGIGRNAEDAFAPATFTLKGVRVAVIASTQVNDLTVTKFPATDTRAGVAGNLTNTRLVAAVRKAAASYDVVVVFLHWGTDYTSCPDGAQERTARDLEAAGADVIVGGHAHRVQAAGWFGRSYVGYGLGNFVWHIRAEPDRRSGVLNVSIDIPRAKARGAATGAARMTTTSLVTAADWTPLHVDSDGVPRQPSAGTASALYADWQARRACSNLKAQP
ncbi:MAG TPA: CapA family protein [Candidatus Lustribacter sp.]|nr:CapA family protein [Candidatus Lustribacter sp.]